MSDFVMPSLGADMEAGTVLEWLVKPGDVVKRGDIVAVVDTSKAEIEVEIFEDGVIGDLLVGPGQRVPVGTPLATVLPASANGRRPAATPAPAPATVQEAEPAAARAVATAAALSPTDSQAPAPSAPARRLRVSPLARRAAEQLGVDLVTVIGTGPGGAIRIADVEAAVQRAEPSTPALQTPAEPLITAAPTPVAPPAPAPSDRQAAMRQAIAALMARSKREIPHYYLQTEIDMSLALAWLHGQNLERPVNERLLSSVLLLSATARAVAEMPELNGFWIDGAFRAADHVQLGVAISLRGGGLVAPALHDADQMSLDELMKGMRDLVQRTRSGRLRSSEMADPTITVTNLGDRGVDLVHGVIYPPQVALVGFGAIRERPWASAGMLGARPVVIATLAGDHRATDGHTGSQLLTLIDHRLQEPEKL